MNRADVYAALGCLAATPLLTVVTIRNPLLGFAALAVGLLLVAAIEMRPSTLTLTVFIGFTALLWSPTLASGKQGAQAALVLTGIVAVSTIRRDGLRLWLGLPLAWTVGFGILTGLSAGLRRFDQTGLLAGATLALLGGAGMALGRRCDAAEVNRVFRGLTVIADVSALIALIELELQRPLFDYSRYQHLGLLGRNPFRPAALFAHPLIFATILTAIAMANLIRRGHAFRGVLLPLAGAAASQSRTLLVVVLVATLAMLWMHRSQALERRGRAVVVAGGLAAALLLTIRLAPSSEISQRLTEGTRTQTTRLSAVHVAQELTNGDARYIGNGPKYIAEITTQGDVALGENNSLTALDNEFATTYAEFGWLGLLLIITVIAAVIRSVRRPHFDRRAAILALGLMASFTTADSLYWNGLTLLMMWAAGLATSKTARSSAVSGNRDRARLQRPGHPRGVSRIPA